MELLTCVLCGDDIAVEASGWAGGNNPSPLSEDGRCCNKCNTLVIIARLSVSKVMELEGIEKVTVQLLDDEVV